MKRKRHGQEDMFRKLREVFKERDVPDHIRSDNGPEYIAKVVRARLKENKAGALYIKPGAPWQNGVGESLNGKLRDECLHPELFTSSLEAKVVVDDYREHCNQRRPHRSLDYCTPAVFAAQPRLVSPLWGSCQGELRRTPSPNGTQESALVHSVPLI
ncbi:MAG: integrase core domain-containing protein [Planctomycetes bacterium]|nr:integrase core domain-containing protein [Planctomycetota bacterium]